MAGRALACRVGDVLKHVPQTDLVAKSDLVKMCQKSGVGKNLTNELITELVDDDQLYEVKVPRAGKKPKILLSRSPITTSPGLLLDALSQNSQGHYLIPATQFQAKKDI